MLKRFSQKKRRLYTISILALAMLLIIALLPSGLIGFNSKINPVQVARAASFPYSIRDIALNPGADESKLNFTWLTPGLPAASIVQMAKKADMSGNAFPEATKVMTFTGQASPATTVTDSVYYSNKATATGLANQTQYVYRVGDGNEDNWSPIYNYTTQDPTNYTLMFVGDPQIGSSGSVTNDTYGWTKTLKQAVGSFPNFSFIMSAGDQIENKSSTSLETEYDAFESPEILRSLPIATVVGNHDVNVNYKYHYNVPNESTLGMMKDNRNKDILTDNTYGGDYYYTYGDTLFMVLDTNNSNGAEHTKFMQDTVKAVPNTKWRIVTFHHDIYGGGQAHSTEQVILNLRAALFPTLDALDVDMIFMGHDHSYVRTYVMNGDNVQGRQLVDSQGRDVNPNGSTYVTANSASGSKYYELNTTPERYSASRSQLHTPTFSTIKVTPSSLTVDTYRSDTLEKLDTYGFVKEAESVKINSNTTQQKDTSAAINYYYAVSNANAVQNLDTTFTYDSTKIKFEGAEAVASTLGKLNVAATPGEVKISAHPETPFRSQAYGKYEDLIKLTFTAVDKKNPTAASVKLTASAMTTQNKHSAIPSNIDENTAVVTVGTPVSGITLSKSTLTLITGSTANLTAAVTPADATNPAINWITSDPAVATVDANGKVTAKQAGTANIIAQAADGSNVAGSSKVSVYNQSGSGGGVVPTASPTASPTATAAPTATPVPSSAPGTGATAAPGSSTKVFTDVPGSYWAAAAINDLVSKGILNGTSANSFEPGRSVSRAEFTAMLVRALGLTDKTAVAFTDVKSGDWYADSVAAAVKAGIVQGTSASVFGAKANITREEMVTMLMRGYEKLHGKVSADSSSAFKDEAQISSWAAAYVKKAAALGLVNGRAEGVFQPRGITTRGEAAQVIYNLLNQ
ncbi:hypothetical protein A3842_20425 [Paenibacillus sp. P3E]|uniref:S-layer homology domain-containing protein n=1 Tax=Paenibacillus sp. P3E TaxID=1349435 RepID=UPI00093A1A1F|nr:S-layer homology domain-containing protein [Paenibacillus sp. P3E]OKP74622.1 hypothetical protein A3842_20425 [Paenibacillus sp. P3E]